MKLKYRSALKLKYPRADDCPNKAKHTPITEHVKLLYTERKNHTQHRCPTCGFWVIWKKKPKRKT